MALFSRKTKKEETKAAPVAAPAAASVKAATTLAHVLRNPRITEKATVVTAGSVYVFDVAPDSNKKQIMAAMQSVYNVKPRKVAVVNIKSKETRNMRTGKYGVKGGGKKAYVYLNKGETITIA